MSTTGSTAGLPINGLINPITTTTPQRNDNSQLGQDAFLKLLTTQLQNQDPLNPVDQTQSIAQLAQFSSLQATTELKDAFTCVPVELLRDAVGRASRQDGLGAVDRRARERDAP